MDGRAFPQRQAQGERREDRNSQDPDPGGDCRVCGHGRSGYRFAFQGNLRTLHPGKKLFGRAVTCCFAPQRPDVRRNAFETGAGKGWRGDCNQWVIDSLVEGDVVVCDLYDKVFKGTFVGGNLTTAIQARTRTGGAVVWGGVRDLEQMRKIDVQVYFRGVDPTPIRDCQIVSFNGPCRIGEALCLPGDIVVGNENGVLFVPSHLVDTVIENAFKMQARDLFAFPRLRAGVYTTADVDAPVWPPKMLGELIDFLERDEAGKRYRGMDWSLEWRAAQGDEAAVEEMLRRFDIEPLSPGEGVAFL